MTEAYLDASLGTNSEKKKKRKRFLKIMLLAVYFQQAVHQITMPEGKLMRDKFLLKHRKPCIKIEQGK